MFSIHLVKKKYSLQIECKYLLSGIQQSTCFLYIEKSECKIKHGSVSACKLVKKLNMKKQLIKMKLNELNNNKIIIKNKFPLKTVIHTILQCYDVYVYIN